MANHNDSATASPKLLAGDSLAYYKTQYEQLEAELADFQASSKELEAELEKDVEAAEKRERDLRQKVESLGYEVEEWKASAPRLSSAEPACVLTVYQTKYKQSKAEANTAQNALQKEITSLRESNRTIQSRLRDIEVSNDDMERQARNTTSSLEDLESKYSIAIERGVLAEEEIRSGEQERESLRIQAQRLRDELNDLKIEADIRQNKLEKAETVIESLREGGSTHADALVERPQSGLSEFSPTTSASSQTFATPATKSVSSTVSETPTPPSPPSSEKSNSAVNTTKTTLPIKPKSQPSDANITPRPTVYSSRTLKHSRRPSVLVNGDKTPYKPPKRTMRPSVSSQKPQGLVHSGSLYHLHGLMNKMQSLEQRVHSVRSKLPAPTSTPPRTSPRSGSALGQSFIPSNVTVRSSKKRTGDGDTSLVHTPADRPSSRLSSVYTNGLPRPSSRLSSVIPKASPSREPDVDLGRPPSRDPHNSRPSSRQSLTSRKSISHVPSASVSATSRPGSRQSMTGSRTPIGHYSSTAQTEPRRPNSSLGSYAGNANGHTHSSSVSRMSNYSYQLQQTEEEPPDEVVTPTPSRKPTFPKDPASNLPSFSANKPRVSGVGSGRRRSSGTGEMGPPERKAPTRKLSEVGESY